MRRLWNPPNPWNTAETEWLDAPPPAELEVYEEQAKSLISENDSPDVGYRFSINAYRGCFHACAYCYARPSHQYLGFGAGTDFEHKIVVKVNAPELLRKEFMKKSWAGSPLSISGNTDCYQPLEAVYQLTRRCLQVCLEFRNPVSLITKAALIRRDIDVLSALAKKAAVFVNFSIPFSDPVMARKMEPNAPLPEARWAAMKALSAAGIQVGVGIAPVIPGLNDSQIAEILERAKESGASTAFRILLRLPSEVKDVFFHQLQETYPERVQKVTHALKEMREGRLYQCEFGKRLEGIGQRWNAIEWLFQTTCRRLGLNLEELNESCPVERTKTFRRPGAQLELFPADGEQH